MSVTYSILCDDCKEELWIGQSTRGSKYHSRVYWGEGESPKLNAFLNEHENHKLRYVNEFVVDELRYSSFDEKFLKAQKESCEN